MTDKNKIAPSILENLHLNLGVGISLPLSCHDVDCQDDAEMYSQDPTAYLDIVPSYRLTEVGPLRVNTNAHLFMDFNDEGARGGGGFGAEFYLYPSTPNNGGFVLGASGGLMGGIGPYAHVSGGVQVLDALSLKGGFMARSGQDAVTITANVDVFGPLRKSQVQKRKEQESELERYERYFDSIRHIVESPAEKRRHLMFKASIIRDRLRFLKTVRFLSERGAQLEFQPIVNMFERDYKSPSHGLYKWDSVIDQLYHILGVVLREQGLKHRQTIHTIGGDPLEDLSPHRLLENRGRELLEIDPVLRSSKQLKIHYASYTFYIDRQEDYHRVTIWNCFDDKPIVDKAYPIVDKDDSFFWEQVTKEWNEALLDNYGSFNSDRRIQRLPPLTDKEKQELEERRVFRLEQPSIWTKAKTSLSRKSWQSLDKKFKIFLEAQSIHAEIDREYREEFSLDPMEFQFNPVKAFGQSNVGSLTSHGLLQRIRLRTKRQTDGVALAQKAHLQGPFGYPIRDKYGNIIIPLVGPHRKTGIQYFDGFDIFPAYSLAKGSSRTSLTNIGLDLSAFGFGDHPHLTTTKSLKPDRLPDNTYPYYLYNTLLPEDRLKSKGVFEKASEQVRSTEAYFGFKPAERVESVFLISSNTENASVRDANPKVVFLWDEIFDGIVRGREDDTVPHEVFHCLDHQFGFSLHPAIKDLFVTLKKAEDEELFEAINESHFLSKKKGGHSEDNVFEFFASLVNTLKAPEWDKKVSEMSGRVRGLYYHALKGLQTALKAKHPPIIHAPIWQQIKKRTKALEKMGSYGPLEALAFKPASFYLSQGPNPIPIIKTWHFKKRVLEAKTPVVVFLFKEKNRDVCVDVKLLARKYKGYAELLAMEYDDADFFMKEFDGAVGASRLFVFHNGKNIYNPVNQPDAPHLSSLGKRLTDRYYDEMHERLLKEVWEHIQRTQLYKK